MTRPSLRTQRGMTLAEVMISLAVLVIGMLGLFRAVSSATVGSTLANQFTQAQARAQQVIEAVRKAPTSPTNVLNCLAAGANAANWANCENTCKTNLGGGATIHACMFVSLNLVAQDVDRSQQAYAVVFDPADLSRSSWVVSPPNIPGAPCLANPCPLYDVQVTIGWNDDGTATPRAAPQPIFDHRVTVRQVIAQ